MLEAGQGAGEGAGKGPSWAGAGEEAKAGAGGVVGAGAGGVVGGVVVAAGEAGPAGEGASAAWPRILRTGLRRRACHKKNCENGFASPACHTKINIKIKKEL